MLLLDTDVVVAATLFVVFAAMVAVAMGYSHEAGFVPLVVGIPATLLAGWQLAREVAKRRSTLGEPGGAGDGRRRDASSVGIAVTWLVLFTLMVLAGGFVVGGMMAVMACQRFWLRESWRTAVVGAVVASFVSYFCFERVLGLALFSGWLANWLRG